MSESQYSRGKIHKIVEERQLAGEDQTLFTQIVEVILDDSDETVVVPVGSEFQPITEAQRLKVGTAVVVTQQDVAGESQYYISEVYRLPMLYWLFAGFVLLVVMVGKWRGFASLIGMAISLLILAFYLVPQLLAGGDPVIVSLIASIAIAAITIYLSHGFGLKSHLALGSLIITLFAVTLLSSVSVKAAQLVGFGSEEAYFLQMGSTSKINVQGLLLGGIILGALGVLDDIVVSQVSVVGQLYAVSKKLSSTELYGRALEVGKDHVASLVNTLVLAYTGANLPLFLLFYTNDLAPIWVNLNSQIIMEELVRTLVGSIGLVLAVPLATAISVTFLKRSGRSISVTYHH